MVKSTLKCVMWVGRATVFMVGLAVTVGLIFGVLSRATAHTGSAGLFHLNHNNPVTALSTLTGTLSGAVLKVDNNGTGSALSLEAGSGRAPLTVNSAAGKATNLNADKLDGQEASSFANVVHAHAGEEITSGTVAEARIDGSIARDAEVINTVKAGDGAGSGLDADQLDGMDSSQFAPKTVESSHLVGGANEPGFQNGWSNKGGLDSVTAFYKDPYGVVHLSGTVTGGTFGTSDTGTIFELPCGYGPNRDHNFPVASTGVFGDTLGHVEIFWAGCADGTFGAEVKAISGSRDSLSLDGITFRAYGGAGAASATAGVPPARRQ